MFLVNQAMVDVPIGTAALIVVLGMAVVFFGLILLMYVTKITGKIMQSREKKADVHTEAPAAVPAPAKAAAPGIRKDAQSTGAMATSGVCSACGTHSYGTR